MACAESNNHQVSPTPEMMLFKGVLVDPRVYRVLITPEIPQRSSEWFEARRLRLTASDAQKVVSGKKSMERLFEEKTLQRQPFQGNKFTQNGAAHESTIVEKYKEMYPEEVVFEDLSMITHPEYDHFAASLDACTASGINVELKTIHGEKVKSVPISYKSQVQFQMHCTGLEKSHLVQYYVDLDKMVITEYDRNEEWFEENKKKFYEFVERVRNYKEPFPFIKRVTKTVDALGDLVEHENENTEERDIDPFIPEQNKGDDVVEEKDPFPFVRKLMAGYTGKLLEENADCELEEVVQSYREFFPFRKPVVKSPCIDNDGDVIDNDKEDDLEEGEIRE
jgi:putative phage-type endonuclease